MRGRAIDDAINCLFWLNEKLSSYEGMCVEIPLLGKDHGRWSNLSEDEQRRQKLDFINDHNERIDRADVLFVFNIDNHVGNSVTLEIGYALAKKKKIFAYQKDKEQGRDVLYGGYATDPSQLLKHINSL